MMHPAHRRPRIASSPFGLLALSSAAFALAAALGAGAAESAAPTPFPSTLEGAQVQRLLDAGRPEEALERIERSWGRRPKEAEALLLRSTARFMLGEQQAGRDDLERALERDPALRQGWLNRAALDIAEERYDQALLALGRARDLDPRASDNDLNLGAVYLLKGDAARAGEHFRRYLAADPGDAGAHYLVASNYAASGFASEAIRHLGESIARDERLRLRARTDPNFQALAADPDFRRLLEAEPQRPPTGWHVAFGRFPVPNEGGNGPLLTAVLDTLQLGGERVEPLVEVTDSWALIWGDYRIEVRSAAAGAAAGGSETGKAEGLVEISAPPERFTESAFRQRADDLLRRIRTRLIASGLQRKGAEAEPPGR